MKKILLLSTVLISANFLHGQRITLGTGIVIGISSPNINTDVGIEFNLGYQLNENIKITAGGGGSISDLHIKSPYKDKQSYYLGYLEGSLIYYPVEIFVKPYIGAGAGYYYPKNVTPGNPTVIGFMPSYLIQAHDLNNKTGVFFIAGFETTSDVVFNFQLKYLVLKSHMAATLSGSTSIYYNDIKVNLNMLTAVIGVTFSLW